MIKLLLLRALTHLWEQFSAGEEEKTTLEGSAFGKKENKSLYFLFLGMRGKEKGSDGGEKSLCCSAPQKEDWEVFLFWWVHPWES